MTPGAAARIQAIQNAVTASGLIDWRAPCPHCREVVWWQQTRVNKGVGQPRVACDCK